MSDDPAEALRAIHEVVSAVRHGSAESERLLVALTALRLLRGEMSAWEPELITAARANGISWAGLAPALGVASRQAAERRYLRLQPSDTGENTGEARVDAQRDRRAGERAFATWARGNSAALRTLAARVSAVEGLDAAGKQAVERVGEALGEDDAVELLSPLAEVRPYLTEAHGDLATQLRDMSTQVDRLRQQALENRRISRP